MENKQRPIILSTLCKPTEQSITYMNNIAYIRIIWTTGKMQTLRINRLLCTPKKVPIPTMHQQGQHGRSLRLCLIAK